MAPRKPSDGRDPKPVDQRLKEAQAALKAVRDRQQQENRGKK